MQRAARAGSLEGEKLNREPRAPQRAYPAPTLHLPYTYPNTCLPTYRPSPAHQHLSRPAYPAPTLHPAVLYDSLDQVALVGSPQPTYPAPLPRRPRLGETLPASRLSQPAYPAPLPRRLRPGKTWRRDPRLAREPSPPADLPCTGSRAERRGGLPTTPGSQHRHHPRTQHTTRTPHTHTHRVLPVRLAGSTAGGLSLGNLGEEGLTLSRS
jgi:hypothetical protein